jgi:hypothetical protein
LDRTRFKLSHKGADENEITILFGGWDIGIAGGVVGRLQ